MNRESFAVWCEVVCARCSLAARGQFSYGNVPRRALKKQALEDGFVPAPDGDWHCVRCAEKAKAEAAEA